MQICCHSQKVVVVMHYLGPTIIILIMRADHKLELRDMKKKDWHLIPKVIWLDIQKTMLSTLMTLVITRLRASIRDPSYFFKR
jgi:hypothetical protein